MFREISKATLAKENFSVGSTVRVPNSSIKHNVFMLVKNKETRTVQLLNIETFELLGINVHVEDPNHLTRLEAEEVLDTLGLNYTLSDFIINAAGNKL